MFDIAVVGGGINGCGIARDAAGRGLSVLLLEKHDLASGTSCASTKLVHGGLRYLEHYEFALVREALKEREVLLQMAPHIIWPMRFVLPHHRALRPRWLIRLGLFLYDHIGGRKILPPSHNVNLSQDPAGKPLKNEFYHGFEYSDCWVDDARLVVLTAQDAASHGADIRVGTELASAERGRDAWQLQLRSADGGEISHAEARVLVNAAGPWVGSVMSNRLRINSKAQIRLVKGSHIVVPRLFDHDRAYIFQNADQRVCFAIPYEEDFTLIGTTDVDVEGEPDSPQITDQEISYLCDAVSGYFKDPVRPSDVIWTFSGIRPLYDDGVSSAQEITRDYVLELDAENEPPPLLSVFGGKITTYRHLAEDALAKLSPWLAQTDPPWTSGSHLPGGDFKLTDRPALEQRIRSHCPAIGKELAQRYARTYGLTALEFLPETDNEAKLGEHFGAGLYACEVRHLIAYEWARDADDILWRRTKLGLRLDQAQIQHLQDWIAGTGSITAAPAAE